MLDNVMKHREHLVLGMRRYRVRTVTFEWQMSLRICNVDVQVPILQSIRIINARVNLMSTQPIIPP